MNKKYPFKNLVFQGGGNKTFAYHGALPVLQQAGILDGIERLAGTSAGALLATLLSFRLDIEETLAIYETLDYNKVPGIKSLRELEMTGKSTSLFQEQFTRLIGNFNALNRVANRYGWYSNDYAQQWLQGTIAQYCQGNGRATFADFARLGHKDLHIVVANVSAHRAEYLNAINTPDVAVADALVMSQSIPLYFQAIQFDGRSLGSGDYYVDGGLLDNYPLQLFDDPAFAKGNHWFENGVNWETLGCGLYTPKDCPRRLRPINNMISYIANIYESFVEAQFISFVKNIVDQRRSIIISDCCISSFDFSIRPTQFNKKYRDLVLAGKEAAEAYLETYETPRLPPDLRVSRLMEEGLDNLREIVKRPSIWREFSPRDE